MCTCEGESCFLLAHWLANRPALLLLLLCLFLADMEHYNKLCALAHGPHNDIF